MPTDFIQDDINADNSVHTDADAGITPDLGDRKVPSARDDVVKAFNQHSENRFQDKPKTLGVEQTKERQRDHRGKFVSGAETATDKPQTQVSDVSEQAQTSAQKADVMPPSLTKEERSLWPNLPPEAQKVIQRIEEAGRKGFDQYKQRYQEMEHEVGIASPELNHVLPVLKQMGVSPGTFIRDGIQWFRRLSGPNREAEAGNFLRSLGIDPQRVAGFVPQQQQTDQFGNPVINQLVTTVHGMAQDLDTWKRERVESERAKVTSDIEKWSKDKPYFEQVRPDMGRLIGAGYFIENGYPNYDKLYDAAVNMNPEIRAAIQAEAATKQQEQQQQVIAQQRHAARSLPAAHTPGPLIKPNKKPNGKAPTARDDIVAAFNEVRGQY